MSSPASPPHSGPSINPFTRKTAADATGAHWPQQLSEQSKRKGHVGSRFRGTSVQQIQTCLGIAGLRRQLQPALFAMIAANRFALSLLQVAFRRVADCDHGQPTGAPWAGAGALLISQL